MERSKPLIGLLTAAVVAMSAAASPAAAQTRERHLEVAVQVPSSISSEFDTTDVGLGGRAGWRPGGWLGVEAELDVYPLDFPGPSSFSAGRVEALFGATIGRGHGGVRPFARLRPGFMQFHAASGPFPCLAIFPPPLSCTLAAGRTVFALDAGGGVEIDATPRAFVRFDVGDLMLKYPGPSLDQRFERRDSFFSHDFRFAAGAGLRF
jgi:outer membrane protein with beta-barrel domain